MGIVSYLVFGLIAGFVARAVTPGRHAIGCLPTIAVGIVGSLIGGLVGDVAFGHHVRAAWHLGPFLLAVVGGVILLLAGAYQWLPLKNACLTQCRSPLDFLTREWREGLPGALSMGLRPGLFCVGCCWALMTLLFVAGVMNLVWVAAIAGFVLVEKLLPHGPAAGRAAGIAFFAWGAFVLWRVV